MGSVAEWQVLFADRQKLPDLISDPLLFVTPAFAGMTKDGEPHTTPNASIASATFLKPAIFAPFT